MLSERLDDFGRNSMVESKLHPNHQVVLDRFVQACQSDERIVAALLVGSYIKGKADKHSDLDLYVITRDEAYDDFVSRRESFVRLLGEPLFMEDFDLPDIVFLIFPDGSEVEVSYLRESRASHVFSEPYKVLLDKMNITADVMPREREVDQDAQREKLRRLIYWFWHELSHFITAMGRGNLWWAHGQLGALRLYCTNLARLRNNFADTDIGEEGYFKIETALPVEQLSSLQTTFPPLEQSAMLQAALVIVDFYKEVAPLLAQAHGIPYPDALEKVMVNRLEKLSIHD
jgi:predicted nucleotidyltransferase